MVGSQPMLINISSEPGMRFAEGCYYLHGHLNFNNVHRFYQRLLAELETKKSIVFDLAELDHSNSALIAFLVEWIKLAELKKIELRFQNMTERTWSIIKAAGMQPLFSAYTS